jgi:hypothetical protein
MTYKKIYKQLKPKIEKDWGKRCPDFDIDCAICKVYLMLDILKGYCVDLEEEKV